ncbi:uncharacterized protein METZ01_LOCUS267264 [marine metagenome]|uniref:Uncharacterized protein n=1 Tax=marine metagenome TaxID=408172 RepID=A0A382JQP4_9ZZZZ
MFILGNPSNIQGMQVDIQDLRTHLLE